MDSRSHPEGGAVAGEEVFDMVVFKILDRPVNLFTQLKQMKAADDTSTRLSPVTLLACSTILQIPECEQPVTMYIHSGVV